MNDTTTDNQRDDLEQLTQKVVNGEDLSGADEKTLKLIRALIKKNPKYALSGSAKKRIDNILYAKISAMTQAQQSTKQKNEKSSWFSRNKKWIFGLLGGVGTVALGVFAFFIMVAAPLVIGSNIDPVTKGIAYNAPIKITFSSLMNHDKTQSAFSIEPNIKGSFSWDNNTMIFTPNDKFEIGKQYAVTISTDAETVFGKKLQRPYTLEIVIKGPPEVIYSAPNNIVVGKDAKIVVMFNQPMIAVSDLDSQKADNIKLEISPKTDGKVQWIDTSSFEFLPKEHLLYASQYTVSVMKGTSALDGGTVEKDTSFVFNTIKPAVISFEPENGYNLAGPGTQLKIHFNQPVNLDSLRKNFSSTGKESFRFQYDEKDHTTVNVIPEAGLKLKNTYDFTLGKGLQGTEGTASLGEDLKWSIQTVGEPQFIRTSAEEKDANVVNNGFFMIFSNPMDKKSWQDKITISPNANFTIADEYGDAGTTDVYVSGEFQYATKYTVSVKAGLKDIYGQELKKPATFSFTTKDRDPYVSIARKDFYNLFNGYQKPVYPIKTINVDSVKAYFCQMSLETFLTRTVAGEANEPQNCISKKTWNIDTRGEKNKTSSAFADFGKELGQDLESGIYYFSIFSDKPINDWEKRDYVTFFISKSALTMKADDEKVVVWATDLATGQPVADMDIEIRQSPIGAYDNSSGVDLNKVVASGKTNKDGLFEAKMQSNDGLYAIGKKGKDMAVLSRWWNNGIAAYDFGYQPDYRQSSSYFTYIYTERPIYRPEQKVYFKGIVRSDNDAMFSIPALKEINVIVTDSTGVKVQDKKLPLSKLGTFNGEFVLDAKATTGDYQITAIVGDNSFYQDFYVEEYRKPEFKVDITTNQKAYTDGDQLTANIQGSYYFGGSLKNKKVQWTINSADYYFSDYEGEWYSFSDGNGFWYCFEGCTPSQSAVTSGEGTLDDNGMLTITVPLSLKDKKLNQLFTLEASVSDTNNQTVSNRTSFVVSNGKYFLGVKGDSYSLSKGDDGKFRALLLDLDKNPVKNKSVNFSLYERKWNQVQKKNIDGEFYTEYEPQDTLIESKSGTTDDTGKANASFTFNKGGEMVVKADITDDKNHQITSSTSVYVSDDTYISWFSGNDSRIDLVPDKQEYKPGETAKVLIKSPFSNAKALVTYERRHIIEKKVIDIPGNSYILEVPVTDTFIPNLYVSAVLVKGGGLDKATLESRIKDLDTKIAQANDTPDIDPSSLTQLKNDRKIIENQLKDALDKPGKPEFKVGYANLHVDTASRQIKVELTPDKERYNPRDQVTIKVKTTDSSGKAVTGEISVAVIDQAVLALKTREEDIVKAFYGKKDLGVDTSSSLAIFTDTVEVKARSKGGGGGELPPNIRGNFKDTAYFKADVTTDSNGEGSITFQLPDNLTTWKVIGVGLNKDTLVGTGTTTFLSTKELLLRPVLPRFLRYGDEVEVSAIIQNGQSHDDAVSASLEVKNGDVEITSNKTLVATVKKDAETKLSWKLKMRKGSSTTLLFSVKGTGGEDNVEMTLPVLPYATPEVVATFGEVTDTKTEAVQLSDKVDQDLGSVTVRVYSSLLTNITQGLESLIRYPYGCAEQTMSALVSTISAQNIFKKLNKPLAALTIEKGSLFENERLMAEKDPQKQIAIMVEIGLQKIYSYQRNDGGFGYWQDSDESYAHLTAFVLYGLEELDRSGYTVDKSVMNRSSQYINEYINSHSIKATAWKDGQYIETENIDPYKANERAFALYVLSTLGQGNTGLTNNLYEVRSNLHLYARGYLLMALSNLKESEKATAVKNELLSNLTEDTSARTAHFEEKSEDTYGMNTDIRSTAIILQSLLKTDAQNPMIPKIIRYLVKNKAFEQQINTQEITYTLFAIRDYLDQNPPNASGIGVKVSLNNQGVLEDLLDDDKNPEQSITHNINEFIGQATDITFENTGRKGSYYYDIVSKYYLPLTEIAPRNNGLTVKREYFAFDDKDQAKALSSAKVGDVLQGKLTIVIPKTRNNVVVEAHLPAGLEAVNFNLETSQQQLDPQAAAFNSDVYGEKYWESGLWHFNHTEVRDDRVALFADYLPAGVYEYNYVVQVTSPGTFANPPALGYEMYFPEVFGRSRGEVFRVEE